MVRHEQVLLCYPDLAKIGGANVLVYQYNGPINIIRLKKQYDELLYQLEKHKIQYKMINAATPDAVFIQDPFIITPTHIVVGRFRNQMRLDETQQIENYFRNQHIPYHKIMRGFLEGGDFICHRNVSFIMAGQRTSRLAIRDMMNEDIFGTPKVARITPDRATGDPMKKHLDLILGFIDDVAVLWSGAKSYLVDVFDKNGKQIASLPLSKYLEYLGYKIFLVSDDEQQAYMCNFVCFRNCVFAQNHRIAEATRKKVVVIDMSELNKMGGGIHCAVHQI
jgi:N-dimethylarginine dimethylaminohydrolase